MNRVQVFSYDSIVGPTTVQGEREGERERERRREGERVAQYLYHNNIMSMSPLCVTTFHYFALTIKLTL